MLRRLLLSTAVLGSALTMSGCHDMFCGESALEGFFAELAGGEFSCEDVVEEPKPQAIFDVDPERPLTDQAVRLDGSLASAPRGRRIVSYAWDFDGDGRFNDSFEEVAHTSFSRPGGYLIALRVTDSEGDRGRGSRSIHVLDRAGRQEPVAAIDASQRIVAPGDTVIFEAGRSRDPDGRIDLYEWDFEGDGVFEVSSDSPGPTFFTRHTYNRAGVFNATLRVTDDDGLVGIGSLPITVTSMQAAFTITPNPVRPYEEVTFDASGSRGDIALYEWDLDGNGTYERSSTSPVTTTNYMADHEPGSELLVGLRVRNEPGTQVAEASGTVRFADGVVDGRVSRAAKTPAGRRFRARLEGGQYGRHRGSVGRSKGGRVSIKRQVLAGSLRGKLLGRGRRSDPLASYLRAQWVGRLSLAARPSKRRMMLRGQAYAHFERAAGTSCLRFSLRARGRRRTGTLTTLGGTGDGATLAAKARFRWRFARNGAVVLKGRIRRLDSPPRAPGKACRRLLRLRP